jgi:methionyl-tRNA formyltransferase
MTQKGFDVLKTAAEKHVDLIEAVIVSEDRSINKDYYDEITTYCESKNIIWYDKKTTNALQGDISIAISWRWMIDDGRKLIILHDSILPRYRGFNPLVSMLINGEQEIGVTALFASNKYDEGNIIFQKKERIFYPIKIQEAINVVSRHYSEIIQNILDIISLGLDLPSVPQDEESASYSLWRDEEDYFIDWHKNASLIKRFVDAVSHPYKGASTLLSDTLVRILEVEEVSDVCIENRTPGKIIFFEGNFPVVVCGKGLLKIITMVSDEDGVEITRCPQFRMRFKS